MRPRDLSRFYLRGEWPETDFADPSPAESALVVTAETAQRSHFRPVLWSDAEKGEGAFWGEKHHSKSIEATWRR